MKKSCGGEVRLPTQLSDGDYTLVSGTDFCGSAFSISISRLRDLGKRGVVLWWLEEGVRAMAVLGWDAIC